MLNPKVVLFYVQLSGGGQKWSFIIWLLFSYCGLLCIASLTAGKVSTSVLLCLQKNVLFLFSFFFFLSLLMFCFHFLFLELFVVVETKTIALVKFPRGYAYIRIWGKFFYLCCFFVYISVVNETWKLHLLMELFSPNEREWTIKDSTVFAFVEVAFALMLKIIGI